MSFRKSDRRKGEKKITASGFHLAVRQGSRWGAQHPVVIAAHLPVLHTKHNACSQVGAGSQSFLGQ